VVRRRGGATLALVATAAALAICATLLGWRARATSARRLCMACAGGLLGIAVALVATRLLAHPADAPLYLTLDGSRPAASFTRSDDDLGYAPIPGARVRARRSAGEATLYDVTYSIDSGGLRVTPGDPDAPAVVFFGCSFIFGEGLNDAQTLPSQFSTALGARLNVLNAGFQGYGPHQMLRALETDRLRERVPGGVARVVYLAVGDQVRRSAGNAPWDASGPRYDLDGTSVRFVGRFHSRFTALMLRIANRMTIAGLLADSGSDTPSEEDRERFVRIVARSAEVVRERWHAPFTVLFWDDGPLAEDLIPRLDARGIEIVRVSTIIPPGELPRLVIPVDHHPGPGATRTLADALAARFGPAFGG
jgi:hypothetical protein